MTPWTRALAAVQALVCMLLVAMAGAHAPAARAEEGASTIQGRVTDVESGAPLEGVTVTVSGPEGAATGSVTQSTDADGAYSFSSLAAGTYSVRFAKDGHAAAEKASVVVRKGGVNRTDVALAALPAEPEPVAETPAAADGGAVPPAPDVEEFIVLAPPGGEIMAASRMEADELINTLNAEEFAKFAASDVADALKFVPGVNVVEGQFAIIRGLEDRYNSTLYNSAPVPSPDPDSQSVQLDLFPSDVVSNLVVSKTFAPNLPSNSSGGAINILTHDYPEEFEIKLNLGTGFNDRAIDRFLRYDAGSPVGRETDGIDVLESEFGGSIGGRKDFLGREFRFKGVLNRELDFETAEGWEEAREPFRAQRSRRGGVTRSGDLSLGDLSLSNGKFDLTESERSEQNTGYLGLGLDLDDSANHKLDGSVFYTKKDQEIVQLNEFGYLPNFDYGRLAQIQQSGGEIFPNDVFNGVATPGSWIARSVRGTAEDFPSRGPLWSSSFFESQSFETKRDLLVYQMNGDHVIELLDDLHLSWAANHAKTTQKETALGMRYFYEPSDVNQIPTSFPTTPGALGAGRYYANDGLYQNTNDIDENQDFVRIDADYSWDALDMLTLRFDGGFWYENANRDVESSFLESPTVNGSSQFAIPGATPEELGGSILDELDATSGDLSGVRDATSTASRDITAWNVGTKATLWERVDLLAGLRREKIKIQSLNDPFTGELRFGAPAIFPEAYLFFDRLDNPSRGEVIRAVPPGTTFNDELLGVEVPIDPATGYVDLIDRNAIESLVNGEIEESKLLPSFGINVRPLEGLTLRGAYSRTVARPSFREMGFYVSVEPATDDLFVGNPQLQLSDVESWDLRAEYTWGDHGDLVAVSAFMKEIDDPIESIVVRNPLNAEGSSSALYRTFFNNPNQGKLRGIEAEVRKSFDFVGPEFLQYLSIGGNFTYIDAKVDRTDAELARSRPFFGIAPGQNERFTELANSRRLFGQPEWIVNADLTFDHPDWGTKATLAFFAISDILDAAGSASLNANNEVIAFTLDRYIDSMAQLDLIVSQKWYVELLKGDVTMKLSIKNLTDSTRSIIYDRDQTQGEIAERSYKIGRDYSFSLTYTF